MRQLRRPLGPHRKILLVMAAALAMTVTAAGGVRLARGAGRLWNGASYPVADPAVTAQRLDGLTQQVYDALDVRQATLDPKWPGGGQGVDGSGCYYTGLKDLTKQVSDSPPSVPGVVAVSSEWGLKGVTPSQAVSALRRARKELTRRGWKLTRYEISDHWTVLSVQPPGTDDIVQVEAFPYDRLGVVAYSECARYPSGTPMTEWGDPQLPAQQAPAPLRG
ncbi:hypothetical protein ACFRFU_24590 [Streptomyces sp. NPDC056704]|uniref:hypothetical protein n=1 Tax=Streptomyces sp. NPDC056704 TaxID=3345917 RepID=UPI0036AE095E